MHSSSGSGHPFLACGLLIRRGALVGAKATSWLALTMILVARLAVVSILVAVDVIRRCRVMVAEGDPTLVSLVVIIEGRRVSRVIKARHGSGRVSKMTA